MNQHVNPFVNGMGVGVGRADALVRGPGEYRVFLYPTDRPITQVDVSAASPQEAVQQAWASMKEAG